MTRKPRFLIETTASAYSLMAVALVPGVWREIERERMAARKEEKKRETRKERETETRAQSTVETIFEWQIGKSMQSIS
jgi:hypothetical protein